MKKRSFTMRVFSVLLCVALLCTFAPLTTLAKMTEQVYVGGVEVTADNAADVLGDGNVSYDKYTKTLTVKSTGIYNTYDTEEGSYGIYSNGDLNVVLDGNVYLDLYSTETKDYIAGIEAKGDLTVTGEGGLSCKIPPANDFAAGLVAGGSLTMDVSIDQEMMFGPAGFTMIDVSKAPESYVFVSENINLVLGHAPIEAQAKTAVFSTTPTLTNFDLAECEGGIGSPDDAGFTWLYDEELLEIIDSLGYFESYLLDLPNLVVGGVKLDAENKDDILGDGTAYFDLNNWELVLDNANITDLSYDEGEDVAFGIVSRDYSDLYIRLIGDNVIDLRDAVDAMETRPEGTIGISQENESDIYFTGNGSLTMYAGDASMYSYGVYSADDIYVNDCADVTVYAGNARAYSCGIYLYDDFYTYGSAAVAAYGGDTISYSYGFCSDDVYLNGVGDCTFAGGSVGAGGSSFGAYSWSFTLYGGKYEDDVLHGIRFIGETGAFVSQNDSATVPSVYFDSEDYTLLCAQTMSEDDLAAPDTETNSEETAKYVFLRSESAAKYYLYIGGTRVTANNAADVFGDGTVSYDPSNSVLTLNNATIDQVFAVSDECTAILNDGDSDIAVKLIGENVIDLSDVDLTDITGIYGMVAPSSDWIFYGKGSLTLVLPESEQVYYYGIYSGEDISVYDDVAITVETPDVNDSYAIYCSGRCGIDSPNVFLLAGTTALYADGGIWNDMDFTSTYLTSTEYNGEVAENLDFSSDASVRNACKTVKTALSGEGGTDTAYDLYIGGKRVTDGNKDDVLGDGTVSFALDDDLGYVVTLNNANITKASNVYSYLSAIHCDEYTPLYIRLIGDNTISVSDDGIECEYVNGIYAIDEIHIEGEGSLTINVECIGEDGYSYGINGEFEEEDLYLEADGEIVINMTGESEEMKGIYVDEFYNTNNGDVTISLSDANYLYGIYAYRMRMQSPATLTVSAYDDNEYGDGYGLCVSNLYDSPTSGPVSVEGKTQAITAGDTFVSMMMLTAYENVDDEDPVEDPDWYDLWKYEKVELARVLRTVTPVLSATEAECAWWDDNKEETVGTNEDIVIGWDVGEEEITEVLLYCDRYNDGNYSYKESIDPTVKSTFTFNATYDYVLSGETHSWTIGATFADGKTAFSEPFDLTFYRVASDYDLEIEVGAPQIGYTPSQVNWLSHDFDSYYKEVPTFAWYVVDGETLYRMLDDDVFMPGVQYAVTVEGALDDSIRFDKETLNASVVADVALEDSNVYYSEEENALTIGALFAPLKDTIRSVSLTVEQPDSTMTPADVIASVSGYQGYLPIALPIAGSKLDFSWTYCEGTSYDEANAVEMENDEFFEGGNIYRGVVSFKLNDRFALSSEVGYYLASNDPFGIATVLSGSYDETTGIVTVTLPDFSPYFTVKELNMFVREPEAGQTPNYIEAFGDEIVGDYISTITLQWYELDDEGSSSDTPLASTEEFKAGVTYMLDMYISLNDDVFDNPSIPVTLNGQEPESYYLGGPDNAAISQRFTIPETTETVDALDFTVSAVKAGETPADIAVTFDDTKVSFVDVCCFEYKGTGDPATDLEGYHEIASTAAFEYGKTYAVDVEYVLKAGFENGEDVALTINGEEPLAAYKDGIKKGEVAASFSFEEPELTLSADTTEFTFGDEALKAVNFDVEYTFDATNRVLVDVVNADGDDMFCTALAAGTETFAVDMSGADFAVDTYTVTVTAFDGDNAIVSNSVDVVVKAKPTTEPTTTETEPTATETEPTATGTEPSATGTEPSATGTEVEPTGTQAEEILYGDANDDGAVNMKDVLILRKQLAGMMPIINMANADVNGDGSVNMKDVLELRKYLANLITTLGPKA